MSRAWQQAAGEGYSTATDLADWLVRALKLPFREAHHVTGRIVAKAAEAGVPLDKLPLEAMQAIEPRITKAVFGVLSVEQFGDEPRRFWRHGAEKRAGPGQTLAQTAAKRQGVNALARGCRHNVAVAA